MTTTESVGVELLRELAPLHNLPPEALAILAAQVSIETWSKGRYLFRQGDALEQFIYLLAGQVLLLQDGQDVETLNGDAGAIRFALAHHHPRKLSAKAQTDVKLLRIPLHAVPQPPSGTDVGAGREEWLTKMLQHWVFQRIPSSHVDTILTRMTQVTVQKGQVIIRQGDLGDFYYVIKQGRCEVTRRVSGSEREVALAELGLGDGFGEMSLLSRGERNATITMLTPGELLRLPVQDFTRLIRDPLLKPVQYAQAVQLVSQGAQWLDVRAAVDYQRGTLPSAYHLPMQALRSQLDSLATTRRYIVFCADGVASANTAFLLSKRGFDTYLLEGGLTEVPPTVLTTPSLSEVGGMAQPVETRVVGNDRLGEAAERELRQLQSQAERAQAGRLAAERARQAEEQENEHLRTELAEQMLSNQELRILMAEKEKQAIQLEQQVSELRTSVEQARAEISKAYAEAEVQMRLRQEEGKFIRAEQAELQKRYDKDQRVLQETERQTTQLLVELERLRGSNEGQVAQLEQALAQSSKAHSEVRQTLAQEHEQGAEKLAQLQGELTALQQQFAETSATLQATEAQHTQAAQELALIWQGALQGAVGDERQRFDLIDAKARLSEAAKRQIEVEQRYQTALGERTRLQLHLETLQSQAGADADAKTTEFTAIQGRLRALEQTHAEVLEALQGASHQADYFKSQAGQLKQEFDAYKVQLQAREQALEAALAESQQQQQLAMGGALQLDNLELEKVRRTSGETKRQLDDLQRQMNTLRKSKAELETEYRMEQETARRLEQQLGELTKAATQHQAIVDQKEGQRLKSEQDNARLRDQLAVMVAKSQKQSGALAQQEAVSTSKMPWLGLVGLLGLCLGAALGGGGVWGWMQYQNRSAVTLPHETPEPLPDATHKGTSNGTSLDTAKSTPATTPTTTTPPGVKVVRILQDKLRGGGEGPRLVALSAGVFTMGRSHPTDTDQQPVHEVKLPAFALSQYEITFADYDRFARETGRALPADGGWGRGAQPVINVTWDDAQGYTTWLSQQTGQRYRLPSEAEWEYAAGGGVDALYWWGMAQEKALANCFGCSAVGSSQRPVSVGRLKQNQLQFYDILGNVKEWTLDCYAPSYQGAPTDGSAKVSPGCTERAVRGGAYNSPINSLRTAKREHSPADFRADNLGFRVVRE